MRFRPGCFDANGCQECRRQHAQGHVTVPAVPRAYFILVQSGLLFGHLEADLDRPPSPRGPREVVRGRFGRCAAKVECKFFRLDVSSDQQPVLLSFLRQHTERCGVAVDRLDSFLEEAGFIDDQHRVIRSQMLRAIADQFVPQTIAIPTGATEQPLNAQGLFMTQMFGQLQLFLRSTEPSSPRT